MVQPFGRQSRKVCEEHDGDHFSPFSPLRTAADGNMWPSLLKSLPASHPSALSSFVPSVCEVQSSPPVLAGQGLSYTHSCVGSGQGGAGWRCVEKLPG